MVESFFIFLAALCLFCIYEGISKRNKLKEEQEAKFEEERKARYARKQLEEEQNLASRTPILKRWKPIGEKLSYLGVELVVIGHYASDTYGGDGACIVAEYVGADGTFQTQIMKWELCEAMMKAEGWEQ